MTQPAQNQQQMRCEKCGQIKRRSLAQNNRLHKLFAEIACNLKAKDGEYHHHLWWKVMLKDHFLGYDEYKRPDGNTIYVLRSTSDLDIAELNKFMEQVERYANSQGVYLDE